MSKKDVTTTNEQMPAFLQGKTGPARGAEDVGSDDITLPRIEVVQSLSKCRDEDDPGYIEGIKEGDLYNTLTRENYGKSVLVIPVCFKKEYLIWLDNSEGGGFRGAFPTAEEARGEMALMQDADKCEMNDTSQHFVLLVREDGSVEQAVISMAKSKRKVSRNWNSLMRLAGGDTFTRVYQLDGVSEKSKNNDKFFNFKISQHSFVTEEQYQAAEAMYDAVNAGALTVDRETETESGAGGAQDIDIDNAEM